MQRTKAKECQHRSCPRISENLSNNTLKLMDYKTIFFPQYLFLVFFLQSLKLGIVSTCSL